ncbi:MAG: hypothetical protein HY894_10370 [Deltaproteobacteria bacterium]|nr:hypothetical protein [Deltaproteobacteria bacterium]
MKLPLRALLSLPVLFLLCACSKSGKPEDTLATVNDAPIFVKDLQEELARSAGRGLKGRPGPDDLDSRLLAMIDRKLMVQEAVRMGLSNDERFLKTIKTFWEQTLVRELVAAKTREWSDSLKVSDAEIKALYDRMRYKAWVLEAHTPDPLRAERIKAMMLGGKRARGAKTRGPLYAENMGADDPLYNAFEMRQGEAAIWPEPGGYLIIMVTRKERLPLPPLAAVYDETKGYIFEQKKERAMEEWVAGLKKTARMEIDREGLKKVKSGR